MAIEDSMILARCLEASTRVAHALQCYEAARLNRTSRIVNSAFEGTSRLRNRELAELRTAGSRDLRNQHDALLRPLG